MRNSWDQRHCGFQGRRHQNSVLKGHLARLKEAEGRVSTARPHMPKAATLHQPGLKAHAQGHCLSEGQPVSQECGHDKREICIKCELLPQRVLNKCRVLYYCLFGLPKCIGLNKSISFTDNRGHCGEEIHVTTYEWCLCVHVCVCACVWVCAHRLIFGVLWKEMGAAFSLENELGISGTFWLPTVPLWQACPKYPTSSWNLSSKGELRDRLILVSVVSNTSL